MDRLKNLIKGLDSTIQQLRVEGEFKEKFLNLVQLAHSPFVQGLLGSFNVDGKILDTILDALLYDKQVADIVGTIANIFECFSVDRFIGVETEKEMEDLAVEMNKKKLFLAGIYFGDEGYGAGSELTDHSYKLRMDIDNTPVTLENRNRFWFPGPDGNFELQMRYHRGFIQIQHIIDQAITKTIVELENERLEQEWKSTTTVAPTTSIWDDDDEYEEEEETAAADNKSTTPTTGTVSTTIATDGVAVNSTDTIDTTIPTEPIFVETETQPSTTSETILPTTTIQIETEQNNSSSPTVNIHLNKPAKAADVDLTFRDDRPQLSETDTANGATNSVKRLRKKRSPQFNFLDLLTGGGDIGSTSNTVETFNGSIKLSDQQIYTKQFPYPKYRKDNFKTGLYLAQSIQLAFFFALIIQVSASVRQRIWMRESGNSTVRSLTIHHFIITKYNN